MALPGAVSVTTAPTTIITPAQGTRLILLYNSGSQTVFLKLDGSATVLTIANGFPLPAGGTYQWGAGFGASGCELPFPIQGIVAAGTCNVVPQTAPF